jgi:hypothetical protein
MGGIQLRTRSVTTPPVGAGVCALANSMMETRSCEPQPPTLCPMTFPPPPPPTSTSRAALTPTFTLTTSGGDLEPSSGVEPWILGVIIGGALLAVVLVGLVVFCIVKRRRHAEEQPAGKPAAELKQQYAAISVRPPDDDYDELHLRRTYDVVPDPDSRGDYVAGRVSAGDK